MWGWFIAGFAAIWLLQFILTRFQVKDYQKTLRKLSSRPSGFLGVGVQKQKLGIGVLAIVVSDEEGMIVESQVMKGVTVFSRFQPFEQFNGLKVEELKGNLEEDPVGLAFKMALEKIEHQKQKTLAS